MGIKLFLSSEEILNHVFAAVPKGYDPLDVDEYLDRILADYRTVEKNLLIRNEEKEALESKIKQLSNEVKHLEIENARLRNRLSDIKPTDSVNSDNINLIRRINQLEAFLFNKGFDPTSIK
ncbi:MAG: DivIVA domain-containing protein [Bacilli bacterium]|nr:DivIVA domain-containing protein [Bacilli bacterium]